MKSDPCRMRRDDLLAVLFVCLVVWCGFTYYLFSQQPLQRAQQEENLHHNRSDSLQSYSSQLTSHYSRLLEEKYKLADKRIKDQIRSNNILLDKLKLIKHKVSSNSDTYIDIETFIRLIENPEGEDAPDDVVKLVDKLKPRQKVANYDSEEFHDEIIDDKPVDPEGDGDIVVEDKHNIPSKPIIPVLLFSCNRVTVSKAPDLLITYRPSKEQFPIVVSQDCDHHETRSETDHRTELLFHSRDTLVPRNSWEMKKN